MSINQEKARPYVPGVIVVKIVKVPEILTKNEVLHKAFVNLFENQSRNIGSFNTASYLQPVELMAALPKLVTEDGQETGLDIEIPELKNKATSRLLRAITKLCFVGRTPTEVKQDGFDLLAYELSEDQTTVIDAWKFTGFTFPNALPHSSDYDSNMAFNPDAPASIKVPVIDKDLDYSTLNLIGNMHNNDNVLFEAMKQFVFELKKYGKDTSVVENDLANLQGAGKKDA